MREQISRLMDGDLEGAEAEAAFRELKQVDGLEHWTCYHIIGDVLRRNGVPTAGFASRFAARLDAEPTVLAPQRAQSAQPSRLPLAWAVAATVAAVAVVSSVAVSMFDTKPMAIATAVEAGNVRPPVSARPQPVSPDYLIAHQEYSPATQIQGVGPYLRAVSAGDAAGRP